MNQGPVIFLGAFCALALSWMSLVFQPQLQLGRAVPGTNVANTAELYPQMRSGLAQQGLQVYRSLGCQSCHSQQVRQEGMLFDVVLRSAGTNTVGVVQALHQLRPQLSIPEAGRLVAGAPVPVFERLTDKTRADAAVKALETNGAKAELHLLALGPDIERGWGRGRSVAADFLFDNPPLPGSLRVGPDLASVGRRLPSPEWHYRHLYDPKAVMPRSVMPPYRFLFERRRVEAGPMPGGVALPGPGGVSTDVIVPTDEARALVAYLLSLRPEVALMERPLAWAATPDPAAAASTNATGAPGVTNVVKP